MYFIIEVGIKIVFKEMYFMFFSLLGFSHTKTSNQGLKKSGFFYISTDVNVGSDMQKPHSVI